MSSYHETNAPRKLSGGLHVVDRFNRADGETRQAASVEYVLRRVEFELRHGRTDDFEDPPARCWCPLVARQTWKD